MKHTLLYLFIFCLALCCCNGLYAQSYKILNPLPAASFDSFVRQPGVSLAQITDSIQKLTDPADTAEGGALDQLNTFRKMWQGRVTTNDSSGHNMFERYYSAMRAAILTGMTSPCAGYSGYQGAWECIGPTTLPTQTGGKVDAVWADPANSNHILAGTQGGLFKTTNGGANWACVTDNTLFAGGLMGITGICVNQLNTNTIYLGTGIPAGGVGYGGASILESYDGGTTWQQEIIPTGSGFTDTIENIQGVYMTPDSGRLYALMQGDVYTRSNIGTGNTWYKITPAGITTTWLNLQFTPGNQDHFFISSLGNNTGIWASNSSVPDPATGWTKITAGDTATIGGTFFGLDSMKFINISMPDPDTLFFFVLAPNQAASLFKYSISANQTYTVHTDLPNFYGNTLYSESKGQLVVSGAGTSANGGRRNIYYGWDVPFHSGDGGLTFDTIGRYEANPTHGDVRCIFLQTATNTLRGSGDQLFIATDGGVSEKPAGVDDAMLADPSLATVDISGTGLTCGTFWSFATSEAGGLGIGGMMHDGTHSYEPALTPQWAHIDEADAWNCTINTTSEVQGYAQEGFGADQVGYFASATGHGREIDTLTGITPPADSDFDALGVGAPMATNVRGDIYTVKNNLWRKRPVDDTFVNSAFIGAGWGFPLYPSISDSNVLDGAALAFAPNDTDYNGYVLYLTTGSFVPVIYYRNQSVLGFSTADTTNPVPSDNGYSILHYVSCITTDPNNTENVWVGQNGLDEHNYALQTKYRVQYSPDHGTTWIDISSGLPQRLPVTSIVYDDAANTLYCATDAGIYQCDFSTYNDTSTYTSLPDGNNVNPSVVWTCFSTGKISGHGFPNITVTDLQINHCEGRLYAATFGRSIWSTDLYPQGTIPISTNIITANTTWSGANQYIDGNIDVKPGVLFTIGSADTVHMPKNGRIIVEPKGHLIVNGGVIDNSCSQCFWKGCEAWGITSEPQVTAGVVNQGWITLENGSVLKNATMALSNYNPADSADSVGGIIQVIGSNLIDNQNAATFKPYQNYNATTGAYTPDLSYFYNNTFLLDNSYKGYSIYYQPAYMVYMEGTNGISFLGDQFLNRNDTLNVYYGMREGIHAVDAGFVVADDYFPTMTTGIATRFCGLTKGISVSGTGVGLGSIVSIDHAWFDTTEVGIGISAFNNVSVTGSTFNLGEDAASYRYTCAGNIGIDVENAQQFRIENNLFRGALVGYTWYDYGIRMDNTGSPNYTRVDGNTFDSLTKGIYCIGSNRGNPGAAPVNSGLRILCNAFANNEVDMEVDGDGETAAQGISVIQGMPVSGTVTDPAANTFSNAGYISYNINNTVNSDHIIYYYKSGAATENPALVAAPPYLSKTAVAGPDSCVAGYDPYIGPNPSAASGTGAVSMNTLRAYEASYYNNSAALSSRLAVYNSLIDFGNTDSLLRVIATHSGTALYAILSSGAPNLSETALEAVADAGVLSTANMMSLLEQNPDDLVDSTFLAYVQSDYSFSCWQMDSLVAASYTTTIRTARLLGIDAVQSAMDNDANVIMMALKSATDTNICLADTTGAGLCMDSTSVYYLLDSNTAYVNLGGVDTWLQNIGSPWTYYDRVALYNAGGQYSKADSIFKLIDKALPNGSSPDRDIYNTYRSLWNVVYNAEADGGSIYTLDSSDIAGLDTTTVPAITYNKAAKEIYNISTSVISKFAVSNPCFLNDFAASRTSHENPPASSPTPITNINEMNAAAEFSAYPNPASGIVTFSYNVQDGAEGIMIVITNIVGEKIATIITDNNAGKAYWNPQSIQPGVYLYQASDAKGMISKGKIVVE